MIEGVILSSALADFLRVRRIGVWLVVAVALAGIGMVFHRLNPTQTPQDAFILLTATFVYRILALAAAIFSTAVVAQEVEQRTIVYLLTRPIPRWKLLIFRTIAAMLAVFLVSLISLVLTSFATTGGSNPLLARDILGILIGSIAYTSLFVFLSLVINRSMIVSLLFAFGWETFVGDMPGDLRWLSINSYLGAIVQRPQTAGQQGLFEVVGGLLAPNTISMTAAYVVMAGLVVVCLVASAYWFTHFEYVPREDAE